MTSIYSLTPTKAAEYLEENGFKASQADNIFKDIYALGACSFEEMKNTAKELIKALSKDFFFEEFICEEISDGDSTVKYLFKLSDGNYIETVLMRQEFGNSLCISTQSGCNMGCKFCCSGKLKKLRDLTISEMIMQVLYIERVRNIKISNVTVMGIGEPFDNYDNLCGFLDIASYGYGLGIGTKHITVSTCGIVPKIYEFAQRKNPCNLAISLHAPDNDTRNTLMPINKKYPIEELVKAAKHFSEKCNRKVLLEYVMLDSINDSKGQAEKLSELIGDAWLFVNLIPYNPSREDDFRRSDEDRIRAFYDVLKKHNIGVTRRREFGGDLNAACGQLRSDRIKKDGE